MLTLTFPPHRLYLCMSDTYIASLQVTVIKMGYTWLAIRVVDYPLFDQSNIPNRIRIDDMVMDDSGTLVGGRLT